MSPRSTTGDASEDLQHIALSYNNAESEASALKLVFALYPHWQHQEGEVEFVRFTDGITNTLLKAVKRRPGYTEQQVDNDAILLRAYGKGTEVLIDRDRETVSHSLLARYHLAPPLLARFDNGLMYEFIQGRVCTSEDLSREPVCRGVARKLGEWHSVLPIASANKTKGTHHTNGVPALDASCPEVTSRYQRIKSTTPGKVAPNLWTVLQKWILALPRETEAQMKRNDLLQVELERIVTEFGNLPGLGKDGLIFGHCDLLSGNVILHRHQSDQSSAIADVSFIDYEYATPVPAAFDIANHFAEWGGFECDYNALPTRFQRSGFISDYLNSYSSFGASPWTLGGSQCEAHTMDPSTTKADFNILHQQLFQAVDLFRGIPGFYWGIWALIQATISQIDFDYASYAEVRLGEYWAWRAEEDGSRVQSGKEMPLRERRWAQE